MKRKRPLPTSLSRLTSPSMCVKPRSRHTWCTSKLLRPTRPGLTASTPNIVMPFLPSQVADSFVRPGKVRQVGVRAVAAPIEVHVQQHGVLGLDGDAGGRFRLLQVLDGDVGLERLVRQVEAHGLGEEVFQRHLVDALGARPGVEMHGCIDVRAGVVAHGERQGSGGELVAVRLADLLVGAEGRDDDGRMRQDPRHLVVDLAAQIDERHGSSASGVGAALRPGHAMGAGQGVASSSRACHAARGRGARRRTPAKRFFVCS